MKLLITFFKKTVFIFICILLYLHQIRRLERIINLKQNVFNDLRLLESNKIPHLFLDMRI